MPSHIDLTLDGDSSGDGDAPHGVRLYLAPTRTRILSATAIGRPSSRFFGEHPVIDVRWDEGASPLPEVRLDFEGERPALVRWLGFHQASADRQALASNAFRELGWPLLADDVEAFSRMDALLARADYVDELTEEVSQVVGQAVPDSRPYLRFLARLELATNASFRAQQRLGGHSVLPTVADFETLLKKRVNAWRRAFKMGTLMDDRPRPLPRAGLAAISAVQRPFYDELEKDAGVRALPELFSEFAFGRLAVTTVKDWDAEPTSANFFLFAEFSIACIERSVDEDFWRRVLPYQVGAQEIFVAAYGLPGQTFGWDAPIANTPNEGAFARDLADLWQEYELMQFKDLLVRHAKNAAQAFGDI